MGHAFQEGGHSPSLAPPTTKEGKSDVPVADVRIHRPGVLRSTTFSESALAPGPDGERHGRDLGPSSNSLTPLTLSLPPLEWESWQLLFHLGLDVIRSKSWSRQLAHSRHPELLVE